MVGEIDGLRGKVKALWDRLEVKEDERKKFSEYHADLCPRTANAVRQSNLFLKSYAAACIATLIISLV